MQGYLTSNQFNYVLFHLNMSFGISDEISQKIFTQKEDITAPESPAIIFQLSREQYDIDKIAEHKGIPILFPSRKFKECYSIENGSLVFHHDLVKSAFYLLSTYQELDPAHLDSMGRYPYELSVQSKLNVTLKPLVNYYFKFIAEGITEFCKVHDIKIETKKQYGNFCFFPTHDVDQVDTYTIYEVIYRFKQTLGLVKPQHSKAKSFRLAFKYLFQFLNIFNRKNPVWTFPMMREVEKSYGFRSAFYFLPKDQLHKDAYYRFKEPRIQKLLNFLHEEDCEIGLHGTVRSHSSQEALKRDIEELQKYSPQAIQGIRQHRLMYDLHKTGSIHDSTGLMYDTSLGFAEHEGFRASYCLPYRLYDHKYDRMLDTWEIPLNVMDVTLFHYQEYSFNQAEESILTLLKEIRQFNGVFTFLWHNSYFDEDLFPGITVFYKSMMKLIAEEDPTCILGPEIVKVANDSSTEVFSFEL